MVNSSYDPGTGEVHSFEEQVGSHGGLGGGQSRAFLLFPAELPAPAAPLVGAEAVHRLLRGWLAGAEDTLLRPPPRYAGAEPEVAAEPEPEPQPEPEPR